MTQAWTGEGKQCLCFDEQRLVCDLTSLEVRRRCVWASVIELRMAKQPYMECFGIPQHLFGTRLQTQASEQT